mmetsp:Transcript_21113/g.45777  ORF Transcript_21113/g.45777 Transcript_21113/m.45777 type:complete len:210 (+) Transcript_21113:662-1291(+)
MDPIKLDKDCSNFGSSPTALSKLCKKFWRKSSAPCSVTAAAELDEAVPEGLLEEAAKGAAAAAVPDVPDAFSFSFSGLGSAGAAAFGAAFSSSAPCCMASLIAFWKFGSWKVLRRLAKNSSFGSPSGLLGPPCKSRTASFAHSSEVVFVGPFFSASRAELTPPIESAIKLSRSSTSIDMAESPKLLPRARNALEVDGERWSGAELRRNR